MSRTILSTLFALIISVNALGSESRLDTALLAAAQINMPGEIPGNQLIRALETGLWNSDHAAVAVSVSQQHPKDSIVFVFLRQTDGTYLAADASGVEAGNFGKLGRTRTDYEHFETKPVEWLRRNDGMFQVRMRTRAWRAGKRYTVSESLIMGPDATVIFR